MTNIELLELKAQMIRKQISTDDLALKLKRTRRSICYALEGKRKSLLAKIARYVEKAKGPRLEKAA